MRILVCTKYDLHGAHFANRLLPALAGHEIVGLWLADKTRAAETQIAELAQLRLLERVLPLDMVFPLVESLPAPLAAQAREATFAALGRAHRAPVTRLSRLDADAAARLRALAPDLVVSARFSHIFDAPSIAVPRFGILNIHPGHLPEFAGLHAPLRTVVAGGETLCCSVHWIVPGIDKGPLLARIDAPLDRAAGLLDQTAGLYPLAIPTVLAVIRDCAAGRRPPGTPQDLARRHYRSLPGADDFAALTRTGVPAWQPAAYADWLARYLPPGLPLPGVPR